jgi:hypothetical protein
MDAVGAIAIALGIILALSGAALAGFLVGWLMEAFDRWGGQ